MEYNIYIDESGDEGIKRGSRWFIMSAVIVEKSYDTLLANKIIEIKKCLNLKKNEQLHWTKLSKCDNKKEYIIDELENQNFKIIHVAIDTNNITYIKSADIYPYFLSYLFERVTYFLARKKSIGNFTISTRNDYTKEKYDYIKKFLSTKQKFHKINISKINDIKFVSNNKLQLLQLADICCSSFSQCLAYNKEKNWNLVLKLKNKIVKHNDNIINIGIKFFPPINWIDEYPFILKFK